MSEALDIHAAEPRLGKSALLVSAAAQLIKCLLKVGDEDGGLFWMKGDGSGALPFNEGDVSGLANSNQSVVMDDDLNSVSGGQVPSAHEVNLKLSFAEGKLSAFAATASGLPTPFYVAQILPQIRKTSEEVAR